MIKFGRLIARHRVLVLVLAVLLLIPAVLGYIGTRVNYDILTYLPEDLDTMIGQDILKEQFGKGAFSMVVTQGMDARSVSELADEFETVEGVDSVLSYDSLIGTSIPDELIPDSIRENFVSGDSKLMVVFFSSGTSEDTTLEAIEELRKLAGEKALISGMSAIIADTRTLCEQEEPIYVALAVALSCVVLALTMESLMLPLLFMLSIGMAILYNLGSNYFFGQISYITKALAAVLQLGVTMDYSIFLWHSYTEQRAVYEEKTEAMAHAIAATFRSVIGSSCTTVAGFIAMCFMSFTLGLDMGIVMAKGVVFGVITCVTVLPAMILCFEGAIRKTSHRALIPDVGRLGRHIVKGRWISVVLFLALLFPAIYGYNNTDVYYKLDSSLPDTLASVQANATLSDTFDMGATHMLLIHSDVSTRDIQAMCDEMKDVDGVSFVIGEDSLLGGTIPEEMLPSEVNSMLQSDEYKLLLISSEYEVATDEVNAQVETLESIAKEYDPDSLLIGEAPCTADLITVTAHDFAVVSIVSILLVFIIIMLVTRSFLLPIVLVAVIEFAIFINMGIPAYTGTVLPFIASVVIGTIQLGATVDYAILMTNRYLTERGNGMDKLGAVTTAVTTSASSILVSALSFFAATIGVGVYSEIDLISSLCALLARGALISMVVVLTILPAFLYILDKPILFTTLGSRSILKRGSAQTAPEEDI